MTRRFVFQSIHKCPTCGGLVQVEGFLEIKKYHLQGANVRIVPLVVRKSDPAP